MEKDFTDYINTLFQKHNDYDLYNYINLNFSDDLSNLKLNKKEEEVVDYILDEFYDLDLEYYDNKEQYGFDKGFEILINNIKKVKAEILRKIKDLK